MSAIANLLVLTSLFSGIILLIRAVQQQRFEASRDCFDLRFPYDFKPEAAQALIRSLSGLIPPANHQTFGRQALVFEVWADRDGIRHRLQIPKAFSTAMLAQIRALMPNVRITPDALGTTNLTAIGSGIELGMQGKLASLRIPIAESLSSSILASMQPLAGQDSAVLQWVVSPDTPRPVPRPSKSWLPASAPFWVRIVVAPFLAKPTTPEQMQSARVKLAEPLFVVACRVGATSTTKQSARSILRRLTSVINSTNTAAAHFAPVKHPGTVTARSIERAAVPVLSFRCLLNANELVALIGFPYKSPMLPGLKLGASRQLPAASAIRRTGLVLGQANFPGAERPIAIAVPDLLRHLHAIGPTGSGKSTLLLNMISQDIQAGRGVAVFDPKGDLVTDILGRIPKARANDVVVIDPTDRYRSVGINLLQNPLAPSDVIADQIVSVFRKLFAAFWGPRTDDIMRSCLLTLINKPDATLCDVPLLLQDDMFRMRMIGDLDDPVGLEPFWDWFNGLGAAERLHATGPVINKLRAVLLRRSVRDIFGQAKSSITMEQVLAGRKILLVSLPKGSLGEDTSSLIGSMMVMLLWQAAQARSLLPTRKRYPFMCYIDEFQNFVSNQASSVAEILAEARGFGFGLILAHQHLGQLTNEIKLAVLANTRSKIAFQMSATDARSLANEFSPHLTSDDLQNLEPYEAMAILAVGSEKVPPVSINTAPAPEPVSDATLVRQASLDVYGRSRAGIEQALRLKLRGNTDDDQPIGRRPV